MGTVATIPRILWLILLLGSLCFAQSEPRVTPSASPSEYEVKASFLLNFTKFVDWPASQETADLPFNICILGEDPFGQVLDDIVEGEDVNGRPIQVRRISAPSQGPCEIVFLAARRPNVNATVREVPTGVLTVGESDGFVRQGGIIGFVVENRRVRFDVNARAAARSGLKLSSRLLKIARSVEDMVR